MAETQLRQRLAAILAADAAGYSRLMARDERSTVAALDAARAIFFHVRVKKDEKRLREFFGEPYAHYCARVKRWIPGVF